jgi:cell wall-associated NlpC family hydrolase
MLHTKQREALVKEAREWRNTPYRGWSRAKFWGTDCIGLVVGVYQNCGFITAEEADRAIPKGYSLQIGQHQADTEYISGIAKYFDEIPEVELRPGDVVMFKLKTGHAFAHSGIVTQWPLMIHAVAHGGVRDADALRHPLLLGAARRCFTLKGR